MLRFRILGSIECYRGERRCELGGSRQIALLGALLVHANRPVSSEWLIDAVWGEQRSVGAAKRLQMAVARLRRAIDDSGAGGRKAVLATVAGGYLLTVAPDELDAEVFETGVREGRQALEAGEPARAAAVLREALELWRGPALADLAHAEFAQPEIRRLEEQRLIALELRLEADLETGRHAEAAAELAQLTQEHLYRERLYALHMLALYRCGRQTEALEAYQTARRVLVGDIGVEPGTALQRLQEAILRHDVSLELDRIGAGDARRSASFGTVPVPRPLVAEGGAPFFGREPELSRLSELWQREPRTARPVIVAGEPGIGKTRLAGEFAQVVARDGAVVLYGRCDEGLAVPYQPFVEALRPAAAAIGLDGLRGELGPLAPELARAWPELEPLGEPSRVDPETDRFRLFEAVTALLAAAGRARPTLLVLDDLHWAAPPTLLLLRHIVRAEPQPNAFVLATCRETELTADHPLTRLLADLQRDARPARLPIGGLDEPAIAALLDAVAGRALGDDADELLQVLHAQTGGNPFFIRELLAHLLESASTATDFGAGALAIPEELRQVIRYRVAQLPAAARRALAVAAIAGPRFSIELLEAVMGERSALLDGLEAALAAGLLIESAPGEYAFAHTLVRETIYEDHSETRRMRLHRRLGEALERLPDAEAQVEALAYHFAYAAAAGQAAKAVEYALSAGRYASARVAYEDAAAHYERGLRALEAAGRPDDAQRCELLLALADACWSAGQMDRARHACRRAAELAEARDEPDQLARAALGYAGPMRFESATVLTDPLIGLLERALAALDVGESALRARLLGRLAAAYVYAGQSQRGPPLAHQALEAAGRADDKRALADVLATSLVATRTPDNVDDHIGTARDLARVAAELGDGALAASASSWLVTDLLEIGAAEQATRELATLTELADAVRQHFPRFLVAMARARQAHLEGRLSDYELLAREVQALSREGQDEGAAQTFRAQILILRREQGRLDEIVDAVVRFADEHPELLTWRCALAWVYAELERWPDARRELEVLAADDVSAVPRDWLWLLNVSAFSEVAADLGERALAERLYALLLPYAERYVIPYGPFGWGSASRSLGLLATTVGDLDAAARHFQRALEMNTMIHTPLWTAYTRHDYARMLLRRGGPGDAAEALELLRAALAAADSLGLAALAARARAETDTAVRRGRGRSRSPGSGNARGA